MFRFVLYCKKRHKGGAAMQNPNITTTDNSTPKKKGCLALAPSGECLIASLSVLGWLTFLIKFAIV